ncbi:unnamed protein product [Amoebophrya sp. A25]|nr:unnamed protein product [Amoebophrya sp. A25]|eukprot:GSA25T00002913001.1
MFSPAAKETSGHSPSTSTTALHMASFTSSWSSSSPLLCPINSALIFHRIHLGKARVDRGPVLPGFIFGGLPLCSVVEALRDAFDETNDRLASRIICSSDIKIKGEARTRPQCSLTSQENAYVSMVSGLVELEAALVALAKQHNNDSSSNSRKNPSGEQPLLRDIVLNLGSLELRSSSACGQRGSSTQAQSRRLDPFLVSIVQMLCLPQGVNLRNLVLHGFLRVDDLDGDVLYENKDLLSFSKDYMTMDSPNAEHADANGEQWHGKDNIRKEFTNLLSQHYLVQQTDGCQINGVEADRDAQLSRFFWPTVVSVVVKAMRREVDGCEPQAGEKKQAVTCGAFAIPIPDEVRAELRHIFSLLSGVRVKGLEFGKQQSLSLITAKRAGRAHESSTTAVEVASLVLLLLEHQLRQAFGDTHPRQGHRDPRIARFGDYYTTLDGYGQRHLHQVLLDPLVLDLDPMVRDTRKDQDASTDVEDVVHKRKDQDASTDVDVEESKRRRKNLLIHETLSNGAVQLLQDLFLQEQGPNVRARLFHKSERTVDLDLLLVVLIGVTREIDNASKAASEQVVRKGKGGGELMEDEEPRPMTRRRLSSGEEGDAPSVVQGTARKDPIPNISSFLRTYRSKYHPVAMACDEVEACLAAVQELEKEVERPEVSENDMDNSLPPTSSREAVRTIWEELLDTLTISAAAKISPRSAIAQDLTAFRNTFFGDEQKRLYLIRHLDSRSGLLPALRKALNDLRTDLVLPLQARCATLRSAVEARTAKSRQRKMLAELTPKNGPVHFVCEFALHVCQVLLRKCVVLRPHLIRLLLHLSVPCFRVQKRTQMREKMDCRSEFQCWMRWVSEGIEVRLQISWESKKRLRKNGCASLR